MLPSLRSFTKYISSTLHYALFPETCTFSCLTHFSYFILPFPPLTQRSAIFAAQRTAWDHRQIINSVQFTASVCTILFLQIKIDFKPPARKPASTRQLRTCRFFFPPTSLSPPNASGWRPMRLLSWTHIARSSGRIKRPSSLISFIFKLFQA